MISINWGGKNSMISWLVCGTDTNNFAGCGSPPRHGDDWAALGVKKFMESFGLVSLTEGICRAKANKNKLQRI